MVLQRLLAQVFDDCYQGGVDGIVAVKLKFGVVSFLSYCQVKTFSLAPKNYFPLKKSTARLKKLLLPLARVFEELVWGELEAGKPR